MSTGTELPSAGPAAVPETPETPGAPVRVDEWQRLSPLSPVVKAGRAFVPLVFILVLFLFQRQDGWNAVVHLAVVPLVAISAVVSWLVTRWRVEAGTLRVETGLFRRSSQRFPLGRVQAIDVVRPGLARVLGVAELRLRTAGDTGDEGRLAYLRAADAERVRARLLALAHGVHEDAPPPPERPLFALPPGRLAASVALSWPFFVLVAMAVAVAVTALISPATAVALVGTAFVYLVAVLALVWRRFNGGWNLQLAEAADGLRLRFGLLETTAETIPAGRVQALRRVQPWVWRWAPWARLQLDVAGRSGRRRDRQSQTQQLRDVLPAGRPEEVEWLLDRLLPSRPRGLRPAPRRARWKSPLRWHWLGYDVDDAVLLVTGGRVDRTTVWVPLEKVQSLRLVQGPVQRRLGLATLHADVAGRRMRATVRDRDAGEAERLLADLARACRAARRPLADSAR